VAKLYFKHGTMGAGKSLALLYMSNFLLEQGRVSKSFTSALDTRNGVGRIASRTGMSAPATCFDDQMDFWHLGRNFVGVDYLLIDEAQFLTVKQVKDLHRVAVLRDIPVMCFGLRSDFLGRAFSGSGELLLLADEIFEIKAHCGCGNRAAFNIRLSADDAASRITAGEQIVIGGSERYKSICARCHYDDMDRIVLSV
jgi:thymidine kinase